MTAERLRLLQYMLQPGLPARVAMKARRASNRHFHGAEDMAPALSRPSGDHENMARLAAFVARRCASSIIRPEMTAPGCMHMVR